MRKKFAVLALVLCTVFMVAACSGNASSAVVGKWQDQTGLTTWEFKADGTMTVSVMGETQNATYKVNGDKITMTAGGQDQTGTFKVEGNKLTLTDSSNTQMVLIKQ